LQGGSLLPGGQRDIVGRRAAGRRRRAVGQEARRHGPPAGTWNEQVGRSGPRRPCGHPDPSGRRHGPGLGRVRWTGTTP